MSDLTHWFGDDLQAAANGDLLLTNDYITEGNQRIVRRLMTIAREYLWDVDYGASVPIRIGDTPDLSELEALIMAQIFDEDAVQQSPPPVITLTPILNGVFCRIQYIEALSNERATLSFQVDRL